MATVLNQPLSLSLKVISEFSTSNGMLGIANLIILRGKKKIRDMRALVSY